MSALVRHYKNITAQITNSQTTTEAIFVGDMAWGSVQLPAALTSTALEFTVSNDNSNFASLRDVDGDAIAAITVAAGRCIPIPDEAFNFTYLKIVVGSAEAADRNLSLLLKG